MTLACVDGSMLAGYGGGILDGGGMGTDEGFDIAPGSPRLDVKVATLEGQLALLAQSTSTNAAASANAMAAVQADLRELTKLSREIQLEQQQISSHSEGLARLGRQIEAQARDFHEYVQRQDERNRFFAEAVNQGRGGLKTLVIVLAAVIGLAGWAVQSQFAVGERERDRIERRIDHLERKP